MPKVYRQRAGRDYPAQGIRRGEIYYAWAFYRQRPVRSATYPTRAQLTQREELQIVYDVYDTIPDDPSAGDVRNMAERLREASQVLMDKFEGQPESLQSSERAVAMEDGAAACDAAADDLDSLAEEMEHYPNSDRDWSAEIAETEPEVQ